MRHYHERAERDLIAHALTLPELIGDIAGRVTPSDFYNPTCASAFAAIVEAWEGGKPLDVTSVAARMAGTSYPISPQWLADTIADKGGSWEAVADIVIEDRMTRDALALLTGGINRLRDEKPTEVVEDVCGQLSRIESPMPKPWPGAKLDEDWLAETDDDVEQWVIPGLMRYGWRAVVVAREGAGKSTLLRQFYFLASQGLHPLSMETMPHRVKTLWVDLENKPSAHKRAMRDLRKRLGGHYTPGHMKWVSFPAGINLRSRTDRLGFEATIADFMPGLVLLGPVGKMYRRSYGETDEDAVAEVQRLIDELMDRYAFALLLEAHAPHGQSGSYRQMRPHGSVLWQRWPELGLGIEPEVEGQRTPAKLSRWRGDRDENAWPFRLTGGEAFHWQGDWEGSTRWKCSRWLDEGQEKMF